jgi:hypothetical protein
MAGVKGAVPEGVLVQREMERGRSPLVSIPPCGRGFSRHRGLPIRCGLLKNSEGMPLRPVHRLDESTGLSLSMVAFPQCRFRFGRQNRFRPAATSAANFRMRRQLDGIAPESSAIRKLCTWSRIARS